MFGQEAAELLNYVECFPNGVKKGTNMALECALVKIEGFPMWVINGEVNKLPLLPYNSYTVDCYSFYPFVIFFKFPF